MCLVELPRMVAPCVDHLFLQMRKAPELVAPGLLVRSCVCGLGYSEQVPIWVETSFDQLDKLLEEWSVVSVLARLVQVLIIPSAILHRNNDGRKPCAHEFQIHDEPGGSAVSIPEGVNDNQVGMHPDCPLHRVKSLSLTMIPIKKTLHAFTNMEVIRRSVPGTGDNDVAVPVATGLLVDPTQDKLMQFLENALIKRDVLLHQAFQIDDRLGMVDGFEMMPQRFAANGHALLQHHLGLHQGQRVPLDGIGMVGVLDHHVLTQVPDKLGRKGTMGVQLGLQGVQFGKGIMVHGVSFLAFEFGKRVALPCPANPPQPAVRKYGLHGYVRQHLGTSNRWRMAICCALWDRAFMYTELRAERLHEDRDDRKGGLRRD